MGIELASPPFGTYEKEHFEEYVRKNDYLSIGMALTKQMLEDLADERDYLTVTSLALERVLEETGKKGTVTEPDYVQKMLDFKKNQR